MQCISGIELLCSLADQISNIEWFAGCIFWRTKPKINNCVVTTFTSPPAILKFYFPKIIIKKY